MPEDWYVAQEGRTHGPLTRDALLERIRRGDTPMSALVWSPADRCWHVVTLGLYSLVWRYQHRVWALRRAGLPTSPIGLVYRGDFSLALELLRAAEQTGVQPTFRMTFPTGSAFEGFAEALSILMLLCCAPLLLVLGTFARAASDMRLQRTANLVNRAVAPGASEPSAGWPEIAALLAVIWTAAAVGLVVRFG